CCAMTLMKRATIYIYLLVRLLSLCSQPIYNNSQQYAAAGRPFHGSFVAIPRSPLCSALTGKEPMNQNLADELIKMMAEDQQLLKQLVDSGELESQPYHPRMRALHEHNASRLKEIIAVHGWPGVELAGEEAAKAAWLVVQHSVS